MASKVETDLRKDNISVMFLSNDVVLMSENDEDKVSIKLTSYQLDKVYADVMKYFGEATPEEQEDKILSLENKVEELQNLVEQYQEKLER